MPGSPFSTPAFLDNGEFFMDQGNVIQMNWPNVSDAFSTPVVMTSASFLGWDWTRLWLGGDVTDGHSVHLTVAPEVLTDPAVVVDADNTVIANSVLGPLETSPKQQQYSWRIGTWYHSPNDAIAYEIAASRTYLVAAAWGYSKKLDPKDRKTPKVTWSCISSGDAYVPPPPPPPPPPSSTTTTTTTSKPTPTPTAVPNTDAYYDDFTDGLKQWTTYDGSFSSDSKASSGGEAFICDTLSSDFVYEADVTIWDETGFGNGYIVFGHSDNGWHELANVKASMQHGTAHRIMVRAKGDALSIFVDDMNEPRIETVDNKYLTGLNGVRVSGTKTTFDNVVIYTM
ncbi:hypothetical protein J3F83DRAFT_766528 [Trichoderma novae-zelandiae]